jgi:hypothetical protein
VQKYEKSIQFARFLIEIVIANNEERIVWQSGAISCYTLQSFFGKKSFKKGFSLLSGLGNLNNSRSFRFFVEFLNENGQFRGTIFYQIFQI